METEDNAKYDGRWRWNCEAKKRNCALFHLLSDTLEKRAVCTPVGSFFALVNGHLFCSMDGYSRFVSMGEHVRALGPTYCYVHDGVWSLYHRWWWQQPQQTKNISNFKHLWSMCVSTILSLVWIDSTWHGFDMKVWMRILSHAKWVEQKKMRKNDIERCCLCVCHVCLFA